jgi:hypothetical protein
MFRALRKRMHFSPATAIATLALVFAMTGGAYAANKYLITSTKQISPKVLKSLKGKNGTNGANGAPGAAGPAGPGGPQGPGGAAGAKGETGAPGAKGENGAPGATGATGSPWTAGGKLPKGASETGQFLVVGAGKEKTPEGSSVSFNVPLAAALDAAHVHFIAKGAPLPAGCSGTLENPGAASGNLCVFAHFVFNLILGTGGSGEPITDASTSAGGAGTTGAGLTFEVKAEGEFLATGTWAVTG